MAAEESQQFDISWKNVEETPTKCSVSDFFDSVRVWIDKPHVVNRRLSGSLVVKHSFLSFENEDKLHKVVQHQKSIADLCSVIEELEIPKSSFERGSNEVVVEVFLRRVLPRQMGKNRPLVELVIKDRSNSSISFIPIFMENCEENDSSESEWEMTAYRFLHLQEINNESKISLQVSCNGTERTIQNSTGSDGVVCPSVQWMKNHLLPKLKKWAENPEKQSQGSLRLISLEHYTLLYQELKEKYGHELVKNWPENTDPQKFVYEDIAIATYLIHPGLGVDVRRRKIWDFYGSNVKLEERPLDPTAPGLFPNVDWLIGNHSDELTPWIPVMAARSAYKPRYFVLPCCFYDFNSKFVRQNNKSSQYRGYLDYVYKIGVVCGFEVEEDMLRIPSTKRICHIGQSRTYPEEGHSKMEGKIKAMICERGCNIDEGQQPRTMSSTRISKHSTEHENNDIEASGDIGVREETGPSAKKIVLETEVCPTKTSDFKPRDQAIAVRNCSLLSKSLKEFLVNNVAEALLQASDSKSSKDNENENADSKGLTSKGVSVCLWNRGGSLKLPDVAKLFDSETLKKLKNECGGIQTLLRNHRHIFQVVGGAVQLRDWRKETPGPKITPNADVEFLKRRYKALRNTSLCWFHFNHPDGCTLSTEQCPYAHSEDELVDRPTTQYLNSL